MYLLPLLAIGAANMTSTLSGHSPNLIQVVSPGFAYSVDSATLRSRAWKNLVGRSQLRLEDATEVEIEVGDNPARPSRVLLDPIMSDLGTGDSSRANLRFRSREGDLTVNVLIEADPTWPVMHKWVEIENTSDHSIRLLNLVLGRFAAGKAKVQGGERGFPLYLNDQYFVSIAHPAGFTHVEGKDVVLRQYPGARIEPGKSFKSMEAVYGVAKAGSARQAFVDYVTSRMCRVKYGQDRPIAILESFGGQQEGNFHNEFDIGVSGDYLLRHLQDIAVSRQDQGVQFDFYSMEFWQDRAGDLTTFNRRNFPNGFGPVRDAIRRLGMKPALWIDSGGLPFWSVDQNPAVKNCFTHADGTGEFCRASEPVAQIYKDAYLRQMRENHVGLVKFDNLGPGGRPPECNNPNHDHLPGPLYSTEAIYDSVIDFFGTLRRANPDIFIMLYWGYRSPWWLQWGDTYFECGAPIEGASPAQYPTPYARDAVTQRLDQAQRTIQDTPWIGKDSLGVWLSNWPWNSGIGKDRWQEGTIMDMGRGSLLFQLWTDEHFLTPPERTQVATFIDLMKANPDCFRNSRPILGDPNKQEPYGYACSDGKRAFLCLDNATLEDRTITVNLGDAIGLPNRMNWDLYRWYPSPAKLGTSGPAASRTLSMEFRPYEVALVEVVAAGAQPSLRRSIEVETKPSQTRERSVVLAPVISLGGASTSHAPEWSSLQPTSVHSNKGATLRIESDRSILAGGPNPSRDIVTVSASSHQRTYTGFMIEALPDASLPANGPGRAVNGNFALLDMQVRAVPLDHRDKPVDLRFKSVRADFSQTSYGGWPVEAIVDDNPKTGWSIHPAEGKSHTAVFELAEPLTFLHGANFLITMTFDDRGHSLGRFRFSTSSQTAIDLPKEYRPVTFIYKFRVPPTKTGGLFFLVGQSPSDSISLSVDGQASALTPVWAADANWSCPWNAWRLRLVPSSSARTIEVKLNELPTRLPHLTARFLPD
ncbi:MAG: hypothetical protein P4L46_22630 [Fimbriimonas sp.]|nr:hypothetical protein [Fimbriimonas sp.]